MGVGDEQETQQQPSGGQTHVESGPLGKRLAKGAGEKGAVVEQGDKRGRDHVFLAGHAQGAGQCGGDPPAFITSIAQSKGVEHGQIIQGHQRLAALDQVVGDLVVEWVGQPEQGAAEC